VVPNVVPPAIVGSSPGNGAAPIISGLTQKAKTWRENNTLARISAKKKIPFGTTFSFGLDQPATVTLRFTQQTGGRTAQRTRSVPRSLTFTIVK
jgi:hypothetical protein